MAHRRPYVVAIDGPSGSGKTTISAAVAAALDAPWYSSGALYRAVTRLALDRYGTGATDEQLAQLATSADLQLHGDQVRCDDKDLTRGLHRDDVDAIISRFSAVAAVRAAVNRRLHQLAGAGLVVIEGRDIGTEVFPDAPVKVFLDAKPAVRATRRRDQRSDQSAPGPRQGARAATEPADSGDTIAGQLDRRDRLDRSKPIGALRVADNAVILDTSDLTVKQVCDRVLDIVHSNPPQGASSLGV